MKGSHYIKTLTWSERNKSSMSNSKKVYLNVSTQTEKAPPLLLSIVYRVNGRPKHPKGFNAALQVHFRPQKKAHKTRWKSNFAALPTLETSFTLVTSPATPFKHFISNIGFYRYSGDT